MCDTKGYYKCSFFWHPVTKYFVNFNVSFPSRMDFAKALCLTLVFLDTQCLILKKIIKINNSCIYTFPLTLLISEIQCVWYTGMVCYTTHTHKWMHVCVCVFLRLGRGGGKQALAFTPQTPTQGCTCVDWLLYYTHVHALSKAVPVHAMKGYGGDWRYSTICS